MEAAKDIFPVPCFVDDRNWFKGRHIWVSLSESCIWTVFAPSIFKVFYFIKSTCIYFISKLVLPLTFIFGSVPKFIGKLNLLHQNLKMFGNTSTSAKLVTDVLEKMKDIWINSTNSEVIEVGKKLQAILNDTQTHLQGHSVDKDQDKNTSDR